MSTVQYPRRPFPTGDVFADGPAMVQYRLRCARADYELGCSIGAFTPRDDVAAIIARIYAAYLIADATEARR